MSPDIRSIFVDVDADLVTRFIAYDRANPDVYEEFEQRAKAMRAAGRTRYSQWTIVQAIRWHRDLGRGDVFKVNNDFIALYARLMIHRNPEFAGFFELRVMKSHDRKMSHEQARRERAS